MAERPGRRMTLRQLLSHTEKCSRDLVEYYGRTVLPHNNDLRDLSRPTRRRSNFPTMLAMANAINKVQQAVDQAQSLANYLQEQLQELREHALKEASQRP